MAKAGRGQTRRDSKRRVLRPGESVRADGKYQYKYHIDGKPHFVYSWKLEPTDKLPMQSYSLLNCSRKIGKATVPFIPSGECCDQPFRWRWMMTFW